MNPGDGFAMPSPEDNEMEMEDGEDVQDESNVDQPPQVPLELAQRQALEKEKQAKKLVKKPGRKLAVKEHQRTSSIRQPALMTSFKQYGKYDKLLFINLLIIHL